MDCSLAVWGQRTRKGTEGNLHKEKESMKMKRGRRQGIFEASSESESEAQGSDKSKQEGTVSFETEKKAETLSQEREGV